MRKLTRRFRESPSRSGNQHCAIRMEGGTEGSDVTAQCVGSADTKHESIWSRDPDVIRLESSWTSKPQYVGRQVQPRKLTRWKIGE